LQLYNRNGHGDAQSGYGGGTRVSVEIALHHAYVKLTIYSPQSQHNLAKPVERYGHDLIMSRKIMDVGPLSVSFCVSVIYHFGSLSSPLLHVYPSSSHQHIISYVRILYAFDAT
jgi:hypothetical protein